MSKIMTTLPTNGAGSWIGNGAVPLANGMLDVEDIYTWLGDVILPSVFQDAVCGDGVCDELQEERGIGEFGWCGISKKEKKSLTYVAHNLICLQQPGRLWSCCKGRYGITGG